MSHTHASTEAMALLKSSGAMQATHGERTLFGHLMGTHDLLKAWGNSEPVCLAGLFHSIYGTNAFERQCLATDQRHTLQAAIGAEAETLAWLFCKIDRPRAIVTGIQQLRSAASIPVAAWQTPGGAGRQEGLATDCPLIVTATQLYALAEMETANLIEQGGWTQSLRDLYCLGLDHPTCLSTGAKAALHQSWQAHVNFQQVAA